MAENEIAKQIMDAAFLIHQTVGIMEKHVAALRRGVKHLNLKTGGIEK